MSRYGMMRGWTPSPEDYQFAIDGSTKCVSDVISFMRRIIDWHDNGSNDVVININNVSDAFTNPKSVAWKCPIHNNIESVDLASLCTRNGDKVLHYKYQTISTTTLNGSKPGIQLKFYPNKDRRTHSTFAIQETWDGRSDSWVIVSAKLAIESIGNIQDPSNKARVVVDAKLSRVGANSMAHRMRLEFDPSTKILHSCTGDFHALNEQDIIQWIIETLGES